MAGSRNVYPPEFKLPAAEVARRLGVTENRLPDRNKAVLKSGAEAFPGPGHQQLPDEVRKNHILVAEALEDGVGKLWRKEDRPARLGGSVYWLGLGD